MRRSSAMTALTLLLFAGGAIAGQDDQVVGYVGSEKITRKQVSEKVSAQLVQLEQQEYDILSNGFDLVVTEVLLSREAKSRGITVDELIQVEVDDKVKGPSPEAVDKFYEENKARMGGRTREEIGPDIERYLQGVERSQIQGDFMDGLRSKGSVRIALDPPRVDVPIPAGTPAMGPADAKVVMVEFSDFQCPFCRRAYPTVERVLEEYGDRIRFVYRDYPLPNHPRATPSAEAALCAGEQEKYWEYHTSLMTGIGNLDDADLRSKAEALELNLEEFQACIDSDRHDEAIQAGLVDGGRIGVNGTPAFYINGRLISGAQPYDVFKKLLDEELARVSAPADGESGAR